MTIKPPKDLVQITEPGEPCGPNCEGCPENMDISTEDALKDLQSMCKDDKFSKEISKEIIAFVDLCRKKMEHDLTTTMHGRKPLPSIESIENKLGIGGIKLKNDKFSIGERLIDGAELPHQLLACSSFAIVDQDCGSDSYQLARPSRELFAEVGGFWHFSNETQKLEFKTSMKEDEVALLRVLPNCKHLSHNGFCAACLTGTFVALMGDRKAQKLNEHLTEWCIANQDEILQRLKSLTPK